MMNLAEEFALLAYRDDGKPATDGTHLDNGLGGALLLELALMEKLDIESRKVVVRDPSPLGDPVADAALARIAESRRQRPTSWVQKFAKGTRGAVLDSLVAQSVLRKEQGRYLGLIPRTLYVSAQGVEPMAETEIRQRLRSAVLASGPVPPRTAALCALLAATGLDRKVFADLDRRRVKARLKEIGEGAWAAEAVRRAISDIQASVTAAVTASTAAAAG